MLTSTNAFLSALAVADSIKLLNDILYFLVIVFMHTSPTLGNLSYGYLYPYSHFVFNLSLCVSAWLTVSVAVERYILVCHPTKARAVWSRRRAVTLCSVIYIAMTCLALPSALRYRTIRCVERETMVWRLEVELTEMWQNKTFVVVYTWLQNLMRSIIPLIVLIILNTCIVWALRKTRTKRRKSSRHRVTVMMIVVILTFLICITPDAILSTVFGFGYHEAGYLVKGIREITDTLLGVNAGVNFLIYCAFNKVFRRSCARLCCSRVPQTGWVTELDESTYRRLSEAKSALFSNNNSPPRHAKKDNGHVEKSPPIKSLMSGSSPTKASRQRRHGHHSGLAQDRKDLERGVCVYLPSSHSIDLSHAETSCYSENEDLGAESKGLLQPIDVSYNSNCAHPDCVSRKSSRFSPEFHVMGHLISSSLSLPCLPRISQDNKDSGSACSSSEHSESQQSTSLDCFDPQRKSVSQPLLPLLQDKYEIHPCSCSSRRQTQMFDTSLQIRQNKSDIPSNASQSSPSNNPRDFPPVSVTDQNHKGVTQLRQQRPYSRARHRPSSNGLKNSKNSVKSKRAKHKQRLPAPVEYYHSDSDYGHSESSVTTELYDPASRDPCLSRSTGELSPAKAPNGHFETSRKSKHSPFVPPCIEGVGKKNTSDSSVREGSANGLFADNSIANLKNCDGSSLTGNGASTITGLSCSPKTILTDPKRRSCARSTVSSNSPKPGRGHVVRFQDS